MVSARGGCSLLSPSVLDGSVQGLVKCSPCTLIFRLRYSALLTAYFELKQLVLEVIEPKIGTLRGLAAVNARPETCRSEPLEPAMAT